MRRKDREVQNRAEIFDILNRCDTVRIAMHGDKYPEESAYETKDALLLYAVRQ